MQIGPAALVMTWVGFQSVKKPNERNLVRRMQAWLLQIRRIRWAKEDGRFVNRPYECRALYGAWQCGRLFRHLLNRNYFQVWAGHVPQGRQPYLQRA